MKSVFSKIKLHLYHITCLCRKANLSLLLFFYVIFSPSVIFAQIDSTKVVNFYKSNIDEITNLPRLNKSEPSVSVAGFTQTT
ncbi:MAG: hypothetical protein MUE53_09460, partial [Chitinophagales bacterium]|nr:hypothetical protein [Chitinophagales bacterium]MCU0393177.1 hypothetical protein [Thermoflexibacter sp.]